MSLSFGVKNIVNNINLHLLNVCLTGGLRGLSHIINLTPGAEQVVTQRSRIVLSRIEFLLHI